MHSPADCLALSQQLVEWLIGSSLPLALALALALAGSGSRQVTMNASASHRIAPMPHYDRLSYCSYRVHAHESIPMLSDDARFTSGTSIHVGPPTATGNGSHSHRAQVTGDSFLVDACPIAQVLVCSTCAVLCAIP